MRARRLINSGRDINYIMYATIEVINGEALCLAAKREGKKNIRGEDYAVRHLFAPMGLVYLSHITLGIIAS